MTPRPDWSWWSAAMVMALVLLCRTGIRAETRDASNGLFWSLRPLSNPNPPKCRNERWARTPIDAFILSGLEQRGMQPSPAADKKALLRRVTLDLTGLQPTAEEIKSFLADNTANAFEGVVERLLASPRYGERWARHWLDVVHYADSHGHSQDRVRTNAWPYRDYVIRSFNSDKPYGRFVQEQLAGDALFPEEPDGIVALGFIAAGPWDDSSQVFINEDSFDKRQAQNLDRDDMVMTAVSTFSSTTVHCARCHDHKFDPIPQEEYYRLQAVFAGVDRVDRPYDLDPRTNSIRQALLKKKTALDVTLKGKALLAPEIQQEVAAWERSLAFSQPEWVPMDLTSFSSTAGATLTKETNSTISASGVRAETDTYTVVARTKLRRVTAIRLDVLADENLPMKGPGRADNGNIALSEFSVKAASADKTEQSTKLALQNPTADYNQRFNETDYDITKTLDGDPKTSWSIYPETGKSHFAFFETKESVEDADRLVFTFVLDQQYKQHLLGKFRLSVTSSPQPVRVPKFPENITSILHQPAAARSDEQRIELAAYYLKTKVDAEIAALPAPNFVYAVANDFEPRKIFKPAKAPRPIHVLKRGDINRPLDEVSPGALSLIPSLARDFHLKDPADESSRRAALAKWVTDPGNVLTWRSIVNRIWQYHFGRGLVDSPNDFGRMGSLPSHPELLDYLTAYFVKNGGSFKELHRLILRSAVYQQASENNPTYAAQDGDNRYLWRMNRIRMDAEEVRDSLLQAAGNLDFRMGGPADMEFKLEDPNPPVTPIVDYGAFAPAGSARFRRGIYRFAYRTIPDPFMDALDCPDGAQLTPNRTVSFTALQALAMWNDKFVLHESEVLAARLKAEYPKTEEQVVALCESILLRKPSSEELRTLSDLTTKHDLAAACRVLFNSNEFVFVN